MRPAAALVIFAKYPEPGRVKTRLAEKIGVQKAARIYGYFINRVLKAISPVSWQAEIIIAVAPASDLNRFRAKYPGASGYIPQAEADDLGTRMKCAFDWCFSRRFHKVVMIGTDCLELGRVEVEHAFAMLDTHPVVLGPATDGGYYLIGLNAPQPHLFQNIAWSTNRVLEQTLALVQQYDLACHLLAEKSDIDTFADLERYLERHPECTEIRNVLSTA